MGFDLEKEIIDYPTSNYFKAGLINYIEVKKANIKSKKDLEKIIEEYKNLKIGG